MARIRSIKPQFWTSEQIAECSPNARLAFIGMWCFCDDYGIHPASPARLKMEVFPADGIGREEVAGLVDELLLYLAPRMLGPGRGMADLAPLESLADGLALEFHSTQMIGPDLRVLARFQRPPWF